MLSIRNSVQVVLFLSSSLFLGPLVAQECKPEVLASSLVGYSGDIQVVESTAFVAQYSFSRGGGVQVIDVSGPESPTTLGFVATPATASGIAVAGTLAYVADGETGLAVVDVREPRAPEVVRLVPTTGKAEGVRIASGLAYVTVRFDTLDQGPSRLEIFDLKDAANPRQMGSTEIPGLAGGLWVSDSRAYVADRDFGLTIVDVESPDAPQALRTIETPGEARNVCVGGDLAFVADGRSGLTIIDGLSADNPVLTTVELPHVAENVRVSEGLAYVSCRRIGLGFGLPSLLEILDISDPASAEIIGTHDTPGPGLGLHVVENRAYVGAWRGGVRIVDIEDPAQPREVATVEAAGSVWAVALSKGRALVGGDRLALIDIENPERLSIPRIIEAPGLEHVRSMALSVNLAYVVTHGTRDTGSELFVIDFADPQAPQVLGSTALPDYGWSEIAVSDRFAYVASSGDSRRLFIVDVDDPEEPRIISSVLTSGFANDVAVSDGVAYMAALDGGLQIIDVRDAENPRVIDSLLRPSPGAGPETFVENVAVSEDFAYVGTGTGAVYVVDVATPGDARIVATVSTGSIPGDLRHIVVEGGRAYLAGGSGLAVIDVEDPTRPRVFGSVETPCRGMHLSVGGGYAYVAATSCGLQVIDISPCLPAASLFRRGDTNDDDTADITDAIFILGYLFLGGPTPSCLDAADSNDDGAIDVTDAIALLGHLFLGSGILPEPFGACGVDPTGDALECESRVSCQS
jgi:hypothetical protein